MKSIFEGYIVESRATSEFMEYHDCKWESQDIDDSYLSQVTPLYESPFEGGKKVRVTVEIVDE